MSDDVTLRLGAEADQAVQAVDRVRDSVVGLRASVQSSAPAADQMGASMSNAAAKTAAAGEDSARAAKQQDFFNRVLGDNKPAAEQASTGLTLFGTAIGVTVGLLAGKAIGTVINWTTSLYDNAAAVMMRHAATGVDIETLQRWNQVAEASEIKQTDLTDGSLRLGVAIEKAVEGNKAAQQSFRGLGLDWEALKDKTPAQQFEIVMVALGNMQSVTERNRIAANLFGVELASRLSPAMVDFDGKLQDTTAHSEEMVRALDRQHKSAITMWQGLRYAAEEQLGAIALSWETATNSGTGFFNTLKAMYLSGGDLKIFNQLLAEAAAHERALTDGQKMGIAVGLGMGDSYRKIAQDMRLSYEVVKEYAESIRHDAIPAEVSFTEQQRLALASYREHREQGIEPEIKAAIELGTTTDELTKRFGLASGELKLWKERFSDIKKAQDEAQRDTDRLREATERIAAATRQLTTEEEAQVRSKLAVTHSTSDIAKVLGLNEEAVRRVASAVADEEKMLKSIETAQRRVADGLTVELTPALYGQIKAALASGATEKDVALALGATEAQVRRVVDNEKLLVDQRKASQKASEAFLAYEIDLAKKRADAVAKQLIFISGLEDDAVLATKKRTLSRYDFEIAELEQWGQDQKDKIDTSKGNWQAGYDAIDTIVRERIRGLKKPHEELLEAVAAGLTQLAQIAGETAGPMLRAAATAASGITTIQSSIKGVSDAWTSLRKGFSAGSLAGLTTGIVGAVSAGLQIVSSLVSAFKKPEYKKAMEDVGRDYGTEISKGLADQIISDAKNLFRGDRSTAEIFNLDKILGPVATTNIDKYEAKLRDVFSFVGRGQLSVDQARQVIDTSFTNLTDALIASHSMATEKIQELIALDAQYGTQSSAVHSFVLDQLGRAATGLTAQLNPLTEQYGDLKDRITEAKQALDDLDETDPEDTQRIQLTKDLNELLALQAKGAVEASGDLDRMGRTALAAFDAAQSKGLSAHEAIAAIGPTLDALISLESNLGIQASNAAVQELIHYRDLAEQHQAEFAAAQSYGETLQALSFLGALNADTLRDMGDQGMATYERLIAAGLTEKQALTEMKAGIVAAAQGYEDLGLPIDENTQKLIDLAKQNGVVKDQELTLQQTIQDGLGALIKGFGFDLPASFRSGVEAMKTASEEARRQALDPVREAVSTLQDQLANGDWKSWAEDMSGAARGVEKDVNAVSFGRSPGGLKEIPLQLAKGRSAMTTFRRHVADELGDTERRLKSLTWLDVPAATQSGILNAAAATTPAAAGGGLSLQIENRIDTAGAFFLDPSHVQTVTRLLTDGIVSDLQARGVPVFGRG